MLSKLNALCACLLLMLNSGSVLADAQQEQIEQKISTLQEPLYSPFVERYVLDELKQLRKEQALQKQELLQQILDREHNSVDRAVAYATDTITYFFYLIAGATSILLLVGWSSLKELKERVHALADEEISKLIQVYEKRLGEIEKQLHLKSKHIDENREEIELTQGVQSLWLRSQQESSIANKINIYDEILKLRHDDCEALTYKADAVLELGEPQWAANLCHQALKIDSDNSHAFYQLACAYTAMGYFEDALSYLNRVLENNESFMDDIATDKAFTPLRDYDPFLRLMNEKRA